MKFHLIPPGLCALLLLMAPLAAEEPSVAASGRPMGRPAEPGVELPVSEGRELVATACTKCHDLAGLEAYKGYWNRAQWFAMVASMVENGAELAPDEQEVVTDYLTRHYGRQPL